MIETSYVETEVLIAQMHGDQAEVDHLLSKMLPYETAAFHEHLVALAHRTDSRNRCIGCNEFVKPFPSSEVVTVGLTKPREQWHRVCWEGTEG